MPGAQLADVWGGGLTAGFAIAAALIERATTGVGKYLDIGMFDGTAAVLTNHAAAWFAGGLPFTRGEMLLSGGVPNYGVWEASDGWVTLACTEQKFWVRACELIGEPELAHAYNVTGPAGDDARSRLRSVFRTRSRAEWDELLGGPETCFAPVLTVAEAMDDPHMRARGLVTEVEIDGTREQQLTTAVDRLGTGAHVRAPRIGEHTDEVLAELGRNAEAIADLHARGVV